MNDTTKCSYLPILKLCSILTVANLLAHNNINISHNVQVNSLRPKSSVASKWASKHLLGIPFNLLLMVQLPDIFHIWTNIRTQNLIAL